MFAEAVTATQYGNLPSLQKMVSAGFNVNEDDSEGISLLHWAAINNHCQVAQFLIAEGAFVDKIGGDLNGTPLHWAIRQGNLPMVRLLISSGADVNVCDMEGPAFHIACLTGNCSIMAWFITSGYDIDCLSDEGVTPLMCVSSRVHNPQAIRLLLSFNPALNFCDKKSANTALHLAAMAGNYAATLELIQV